MTDLDIYRPQAELAVPASADIDSWIAVVDDVVKVAKAIYDTPFVPEGLRGSVTAVSACILAGREMGIGPMTSLQNFHVIKGKVGQSALLMRSLVLSRGHKWEDADVTDTHVILRGCRKGESAWTEVRFTADQAKRAGIELGKYPQDKLYARASVRLARRKFADVIMGMPYSEEDLEDGADDSVTVTETPAIEPQKPAQRTARRRQAGAGDRRGEARGEDRGMGADRVEPSGSQRTDPLHSEVPGSALPPLPGEISDESIAEVAAVSAAYPDGVNRADDDRPAALATTGQAGIIARHFARLGFTEDERGQRLAVTATIAGTGLLSSTKELNQAQAMAVIRVVERCKTRDQLIALLASGEDTGGSDD